MGTQQHYVLFEHVTGYALFRVKEFDEITRHFTAHVNAFIKPIAFVHFCSVAEAVENIQAVSDGMISGLLRQFLLKNVPHQSVLGVNEESLGKSIT
ncbi:Nucleolar protein 56 [Paragonimus heterotremus]|uniref:Nucleolar protein 56 n=1 Tax=Paragonimus heterotremus TaxID=100268 RepID=A0A8J4SFV4_9TREM|nr:Nucleolar protein 56 [Paragonimus heterotremus]